MNKDLENYIVEMTNQYVCIDLDKWKEIETELKRLEEDKKKLVVGISELATAIKQKDDILRIIKEKVDDMEWLRNAITMGFTLEHYNEVVSYTHGKQLTQEEFDLLKGYIKEDTL